MEYWSGAAIERSAPIANHYSITPVFQYSRGLVTWKAARDRPTP